MKQGIHKPKPLFGPCGYGHKRMGRTHFATAFASTGAVVFYIQDEGYAAGAWMRKSCDAQDERAENCSLHFCTSAIHGGRIQRTNKLRRTLEIATPIPKTN